MRRHLDTGQRSLVAAKCKEHYEKEARERQGTRTDMVANLPQSEQGKWREQAAKDYNVSPRSVESAARVLKDGSDPQPKANLPEPEGQWSGEGSLVGFVLSLNLNRRHLSSSQKATLAVDMLPILEAEAKERQVANLKKGDEAPVTQKVAEREKGESREKAAKMTGTNRQYEHGRSNRQFRA